MLGVDWTKLPVEALLDPEKHGYTMCSHCNGYGSSLKEKPPKCTICGGTGLLKKGRKKSYGKK